MVGGQAVRLGQELPDRDGSLRIGEVGQVLIDTVLEPDEARIDQGHQGRARGEFGGRRDRAAGLARVATDGFLEEDAAAVDDDEADTGKSASAHSRLHLSGHAREIVASGHPADGHLPAGLGGERRASRIGTRELSAQRDDQRRKQATP